MCISATRLQEILARLPQPSGCLVALSGGLDSSVLLHLMAQLRPGLGYPVRAMHIHHGLQPQADLWQAHCESLCAGLAIHLQTHHLNLAPRPGESLEALAREARYQTLARSMNDAELLLTAQHQDDQAETLLLQMIRGSGPAGLAGMPEQTRFGPGWLARPLLTISRRALETYAREHGLIWHEDPSNQALRFDRNFLRHQVIPLLRERWPAVSETLARSARYTGELLELVNEEVDEDLERVRIAATDVLSIPDLHGFNSVRLRHLLRRWIGARGAGMPNSKKLARIEHEAVFGRADARPEIRWGRWSVRRFRDGLHLLDEPVPKPSVDALEWPGERSLQLPDGLGQLSTVRAESGVSAARWRNARIEVRFRQGGERCQPEGRGHRHSLKKLFQEWGIPPWEREGLPLIYLDGSLAVIPGRVVCEGFAAAPGEPALQVEWTRPPCKGTEAAPAESVIRETGEPGDC
ncbi:MAG: tRNA lysidine(34) synthetase TilS [Candidatus Thiodiazotropha sp.]